MTNETLRFVWPSGREAVVSWADYEPDVYVTVRASPIADEPLPVNRGPEALSAIRQQILEYGPPEVHADSGGDGR